MIARHAAAGKPPATSRRGLCRATGAERGALAGDGALRWLRAGLLERGGDHRDGPALPHHRGLRVVTVGLRYPRRAAAGAEGADSRRDRPLDLLGAGLIGTLQSRCKQCVGPHGGELRLITTLTSFATATDISLAELHLEAFLPADQVTAGYLLERARLAEQVRDTPDALGGAHQGANRG